MDNQNTSVDDHPDEEAPPPESAAETAGLLSGKTTQLAVGAAATIGIMILYKLRAKLLAKEDPESYAQVREITAAVRHADRIERSGADRRKRSSSDRRASEQQQDRREKERRDNDRPDQEPHGEAA